MAAHSDLETPSAFNVNWRLNFKLSALPLEPLLVALTLLFLALSLAGESILSWPTALLLVLNVASYLTGGYFAVRAGLASLRQGLIDVDLLMVASALGAALVGAWHEGATLLFLFSLSNVLQDYAIGRSRHAIQALLGLRPNTACVRRGEIVVEVAVEALQVGDILLIRPGESLPADGEVVAGESRVNQATITGESVPVLKRPGDPVFAATVNQNGALEVRVTKRAEESTLARIIKMVEEASERHAKAQRALDRFEQTYAKLILGGVPLLILLPPLLWGADFKANFYTAMVALVVASPCALVISVPATVLSAIANGARHGVLFKGGGHLEDLSTLKVIAFDKTGTLTLGALRVTDLFPLGDLSAEALLRFVAQIEAPSEHPLALAILESAQAEGYRPPEPRYFEALPGLGVRAILEDGCEGLAGTAKLFEREGFHLPESALARQAALEDEGKTTLFVGQRGPAGALLLGLVAVADAIRPEAAEAIARLRQAGIQHIAMLTGDNARVAERIGAQVGVTEVHAGLLPEDKVARLEALRTRYGAVGMVGDGVNDAPALATADVGIAMGAAGTDVALETADVVLMASDLKKLAYAYRLSRRARGVIVQNLAFSLGVIIVLLSATLIGLGVPLPLGVVGHEGSTIIVVLNGLRLLRG
jgi:Cd2+/Zn2+-exporting ATPase